VVAGSGGLEQIGSGGIAATGRISGGTLELSGGVVAAPTIDFLGSGGTLQIDTTSMPTNTIVNFRGHQTIDLRAVSGGSAGSGGIDASNLLTVTENTVSYTLQLDPTRDYVGTSVILGNDGFGGTLVTLDIPTIVVFSEQLLEITSAQFESDILVLNGGLLVVDAGGTAVDTVDQGAEILNGGLNIRGRVESGGLLVVGAGGRAASTTIAAAGELQVSAGGSASDVTVDSGGHAVVQSGGLADDSTIAGGLLELDAGAVASGAITFVGTGGVLQIDDANMPTNTIGGFTQGDFIDITGLLFGPGTSGTLSGTTLTVTDGWRPPAPTRPRAARAGPWSC
jgi:autotransporter passenger strand-loop-strand repeat protein